MVHVTVVYFENLRPGHQSALKDDLLARQFAREKAYNKLWATHYLCTMLRLWNARCTRYQSLQFDGWLMAQTGYQDSFMQSGPQSRRSANLTQLSVGILHNTNCQAYVGKNIIPCFEY